MERAEATARILNAARGAKQQSAKICTFETDADGQPICAEVSNVPTLKESICVCVARTKEDVATFDALTQKDLLAMADERKRNGGKEKFA